MTIHLENFVSIRKTAAAFGRLNPGLTVGVPKVAEELDYRDLLAAANQAFFRREYTIALDQYLKLRQKILTQSHPEMPTLPGRDWVAGLDITQIDWKPVMELGRRLLLDTEPGGKVTLPLADKRYIQKGEFATNPSLAKFAALGVDPQTPSRNDVLDQRQTARDLAADGNLTSAQTLLTGAKDNALKIGDAQLAAEISSELGGLLATFSEGNARTAALQTASAAFQEAANLFGAVGDEAAHAAMETNLANVRAEIQGSQPPRPPGGTSVTPPVGTPPVVQPVVRRPGTLTGVVARPLSAGRITSAATAVSPAVSLATVVRSGAVRLTPQTERTFAVVDSGSLLAAAAAVGSIPAPAVAQRQVGLFAGDSVKTVSLKPNSYQNDLLTNVYNVRINATTLEGIRFYEDSDTNFVAYIPHLFFFVLPIAVGDTYQAMGRFGNAINEYKAVLAYPFLNHGIEAPYVWLKMAKTALLAGNQYFRQNNTAAAKSQYELIIRTDLSVANSALYQGAMAAMQAQVTEVAKQIQNQPHSAVNPKVVAIVTETYTQLQKIDQGLNFLGFGTDDYPVFRFKYLQGAANYMADNAIQVERTFIQFRATAENQTIERIQIESAVEVNKATLAVEQKRVADAQLEVQAARNARDLAALRQTHAQDTLNDWNTLGAELASVNAALSWASNAANDQDITYTGVRYNGSSHDFDTDVEEFYDVVGEWRENLNFEIQRRRLARQVSEAAAEVTLANTRLSQAQVRLQVQLLTVAVAQARLDGAKELLDYAQDRMFDEDLWFQLGGELQDLSRSYLDMAIYAAFLMERAYELEFDRKLNRIRLDYGIGGPEGLLGGDHLKRDIASFTQDYLENAQKKNPVRLVISLADEFPAEFHGFLAQGILPFRTDLELFDRRFSGSYRRKLKKVEVFVEGLVPAEGTFGMLTHQGISTEWRKSGANWAKFNRVHAPERMLLSSYQFRRDYTIFTPSEEMLELFENLGPQGNWTFELPRAANNLDYQAISDIKLVVYFDADYDDELRTWVKSFYPTDGGRSLILSARFQFPDEYFRLDADREVSFTLHPARFAYNYTNLAIEGFRVRLVGRDGATAAGVNLTLLRASDNSSVAGTTNAQGELAGAAGTMAPFGAWKGASPVDSFTVQVTGGFDTTTLADLQLAIDYTYDYRSDGTLVA